MCGPSSAGFQSTHPSGVRQPFQCACYPRSNFNPRTPVGCDPRSTAHHPKVTYFNPRTPVGCDSACGVDFSTADYFNPRTPVGCDSATGTVCGSPSTHFNPRTPVGGDSNQACSLGVPTNFNPRTPVGCDRQGPAEDAGPQISIHAPQWGATTTPKGKIQVVILFQSTHPSGVRLGHLSGFGTRQIISIHAPQWGATHTAAQPFAFRHISIHAPQWGATRLCRHL